MSARCAVVVGAGLALCACATSERGAKPAPDAAASHAGGDAGGDAGAHGDAGADSGRVRIFVPYPDCTDNDPSGHGLIIERCECDPDAPTVCCAGEGYECTGGEWRFGFFDGPCWVDDGFDAGKEIDAGNEGPVVFGQCAGCQRGADGCFCQPNKTCDEGLTCLEGLCGKRVP